MLLNLGCIADDITGASDLALMLAENGMTVSLALGVPTQKLVRQTDAMVVALKTRTVASDVAVKESVRAAVWLLDQGARQLVFKYCSTFDSTADGNIGPVTDALLQLVNEDFTIVCPAFPDNRRTIKDSQLMVDGKLLAQSSMRNHPLTPMRNSNLLELMDGQTRQDASAGISLDTLRRGPQVLRQVFTELQQTGYRYAIPDIETNEDLLTLGKALDKMKLVTGASGVAMGLPGNFSRAQGKPNAAYAPLPKLSGHPVIIAGSCSETTRRQVEFMRGHCQPLEFDPRLLASGQLSVDSIYEEAFELWQQGPVLLSSAADPAMVRKAQEQLGQDNAASLVEETLAGLAVYLSGHGAGKFIIAGGETSGAVSAALGAKVLRIGPSIDTGVPWMIRQDELTQVMTFKSGNFGSTDFFLRAMEMLP